MVFTFYFSSIKSDITEREKYINETFTFYFSSIKRVNKDTKKSRRKKYLHSTLVLLKD